MLRQTFDWIARKSPSLKRRMIKIWYELLVIIDRDRDITFMNYGYAEPTRLQTCRLAPEEEAERYCNRQA